LANYHELDEVVNNIIFEKLLRNQNVCKLLYYYPETNDDWNFNPFTKPDISDTTDKLFMKKIFPLPKMPEADIEKDGRLTVTLAGGYEPEKNTGFRYVNLLFDIIFHLDVWTIEGGQRPYRMMAEINDMINNQLTDMPIENRPYLVGFQPRDYSHYFYGFQLKYDLIVANDLTCSPFPQNIGRQKGEPYLPSGTSFLENDERSLPSAQTISVASNIGDITYDQRFLPRNARK
jgi:hypothetical protein